MTSLHSIDTSAELHVYRFGNGIKLIRPDEINNTTRTHFMHDTKHTVSSILTLPLGVYFIKADSINAIVNEQDAKSCGFDSIKNAIGKTCFAGFTQAATEITTQNDKAVMSNQCVKISEEDVVLSNGNISRPTLSIKLPWYNNENKVIGLFGCSIILGQQSLAYSLDLVSEIGLLSKKENVTSYIGDDISENYLSKRQLSCAKLLLAGMTQKEIAFHLGLSPRTIETYIENIKLKLHCRNKAALILRLAEIIK